jgi:hypothetical protein
MAREQGVLTGAPWVRASSPSRAIAPGRSISQPAATSSLTTTTPAPSSRRPTPCSLENDLLCLEVMYAGDLPEQLQWDTLYHEHVTFYSLGHLAGLLRGHGFEPVHADSMHGGALRVAVARVGTREPAASSPICGRGSVSGCSTKHPPGIASPTTVAGGSRGFGQTMRRLS